MVYLVVNFGFMALLCVNNNPAMHTIFSLREGHLKKKDAILFQSLAENKTLEIKGKGVCVLSHERWSKSTIFLSSLHIPYSTWLWVDAVTFIIGKCEKNIMDLLSSSSPLFLPRSYLACRMEDLSAPRTAGFDFYSRNHLQFCFAIIQ